MFDNQIYEKLFKNLLIKFKSLNKLYFISFLYVFYVAFRMMVIL